MSENIRPPAPGRRLVPLAPAGGQPSVVRGEPSSAPSTNRIGNILAACESCRKKKIKCNGARPCRACTTRKIDCEYDTRFNAETHNQALKRKYVELGDHKSAYENIYQMLRDRPADESWTILQSIRSGTDPQAIMQRVDHGDLLLQMHLTPESNYRYDFPYLPQMPSFLIKAGNPYLDSLIFGAPENMSARGKQRAVVERSPAADFEAAYLKPYHAARLVEPLLAECQISNWTGVSINESFLHGLLEAYFLYQYPYFAFVHKDLFLRDMKDGNERFCSSILVNAILAHACHAYQRIPNRFEFWNPANPSYLFLAESKRLLELEGDKQSLTTVQALVILHNAMAEQGMDKAAAPYTYRAVAMAKDMGLFSKSEAPLSEEVTIVRDWTAWQVFAWQALLACTTFVPPPLSKPPEVELPDPILKPTWYGDLWIQYPLNEKPTSTLYPQTSHASLRFRIIMNEIAMASFDESGPKDLAIEEGLLLYRHLNSWYTNLPSSLGAVKAVMPFQLKLHIQYWTYVLNLFERYSSTDEVLVEVPETSMTIQQIISEARVNIETVYRIYYLRHGFIQHNSVCLFHVVMLCFLAIKELHEIADEARAKEIRSTLFLATKCISDQSKGFYTAQGVLRSVCAQMQPRDLVLFKQHTNFSDSEDPKSVAQRLRHIQTNWPLSALSFAEDPREKRDWNIIEEANELGKDTADPVAF